MAAMPKATTRLPARRLSEAEEVIGGTGFPFLETFRPKDTQNIQQDPAHGASWAGYSISKGILADVIA